MRFSLGKKGSAGTAGKELQKLKRQDLLELLVDQMRENDQLRVAQAQAESAVVALDEQVDRLKAKLDDKDVQLGRLKAKLDDKDAFIDRLKAKLDDKDRLLEELYANAQEMAQAKGPHNRAALMQQIEALLTEHYLTQAMHQRAEQAAADAAEELARQAHEDASLQQEAEIAPDGPDAPADEPAAFFEVAAAAEEVAE